jgi:hypothetical protein
VKNIQHNEIKPVVYELGIAVYLCQQFETTLLLLIAILNDEQGVVNVNSFKAGICSYSQKKTTLGQLARIFKEKLELPEAYIIYVQEGVEKRNSITHGFVMRNREKLLSIDGRSQLIEELREAQNIISDRLHSLDEVLNHALCVFGGSLEDLRMDTEIKFEGENLNENVFH